MKTLALILDFILVGFTILVMLTDGLPTAPAYVFFNLWIFLTLLFTAVVLFRNSSGTAVKVAAVVCNALLIGFTLWALIDQYPHPRESGFIAFVVLMFLAPLANLWVLSRELKGDKAPATGIHFGLTL